MAAKVIFRSHASVIVPGGELLGQLRQTGTGAARVLARLAAYAPRPRRPGRPGRPRRRATRATPGLLPLRRPTRRQPTGQARNGRGAASCRSQSALRSAYSTSSPSHRGSDASWAVLSLARSSAVVMR
jgi:hypothetical protein